MDRDPRGLCRPLDHHPADRRVLELLLDKAAHFQVRDELLRIVLAIGVPHGIVVLHDAEANARGIDFLTHVVDS